MSEPAVPRRFTVRQWQTIDATLDNTAAVESVDGGERIADRARGLREIGWVSLRHHRDRGLGSMGWPPDDAPLDVCLTCADLVFIREQLEGWNAMGREMPGPGFEHRPGMRREQGESLTLGVDALATVEALIVADAADRERG